MAEQVLEGASTEPAVTPSIEGGFGGAFVTLWSGKELRGCVGSFAPTTDIVGSVRDATREALRDPRFASIPVTLAELQRINLEVSVLSHLTVTKDPAKLVPGVHGVLIRQGFQSGCFLPKVAAEHGWSAEQLLSNCCTMKAGLPADAWRDPGAFVELFTADAFSEADLGGADAVGNARTDHPSPSA